jgi:hypothetical protein
MTRNDEIRRLLDTLLERRSAAVGPFMQDRYRADAAMTLAYDCDELLGSIVPALLAENEEQARRIERLERALHQIESQRTTESRLRHERAARDRPH